MYLLQPIESKRLEECLFKQILCILALSSNILLEQKIAFLWDRCFSSYNTENPLSGAYRSLNNKGISGRDFPFRAQSAFGLANTSPGWKTVCIQLAERSAAFIEIQSRYTHTVSLFFPCNCSPSWRRWNYKRSKKSKEYISWIVKITQGS